MGVTKSNAYQCDFCSGVQVTEDALPVGWVRRVCNRPLGNGAFTSLAGEPETLIFCCDAHEVKWLEARQGPGRADNPMSSRMVVFRELYDIGTVIARGYHYGVFRRRDHFGDKTVTSEEEFEGYLMTETQLYSLRCALRDARPYLEDTDA